MKMFKFKCSKNVIRFSNTAKFSMMQKKESDFAIMNKFYFIIKYYFIENLVISLLLFLIRLILYNLNKIPNNF
jgi:hypothetical protein